MLHPARSRCASDNDSSCVLLCAARAGSALLAGDVEAHRRVGNRRRRAGARDVVVVPHHGSRTSSSAPFVAAARPALALVSAGYRNRWGLPRREVVERWRDAGARRAHDRRQRRDRDHVRRRPSAASRASIGRLGAATGIADRSRRAAICYYDANNEAHSRHSRPHTHVRNRESRRSHDGADHPRLHRRRGDHPGAAVDAAVEAGAAGGAHRQGVALGRAGADPGQAHRCAGAEFAARQSPRRRSRQPPSRPRDPQGERSRTPGATSCTSSTASSARSA